MGYYKNFHRKLDGFGINPVKSPAIPPREASFWFWNPNMVGVTFAPTWFLTKLHEIDPDTTITWDRYHERWLVWAKQPRLQSRLCSGWMLLFPVKYSDGAYMPLDERIFAALYQVSARKWDRAKDYFNHVQAEMNREREHALKVQADETQYKAGEYYDYMTIKNIGSGSKFADHWQG